jgi:hypothetical protein
MSSSSSFFDVLDKEVAKMEPIARGHVRLTTRGNFHLSPGVHTFPHDDSLLFDLRDSSGRVIAHVDLKKPRHVAFVKDFAGVAEVGRATCHSGNPWPWAHMVRVTPQLVPWSIESTAAYNTYLREFAAAKEECQRACKRFRLICAANPLVPDEEDSLDALEPPRKRARTEQEEEERAH